MPRPQDRSYWADVENNCSIHGDFMGVICPKCHDQDRIRIERESAELRALRTPDFMRRQRAAALAEANGDN